MTSRHVYLIGYLNNVRIEKLIPDKTFDHFFKLAKSTFMLFRMTFFANAYQCKIRILPRLSFAHVIKVMNI